MKLGKSSNLNIISCKPICKPMNIWSKTFHSHIFYQPFFGCKTNASVCWAHLWNNDIRINTLLNEMMIILLAWNTSHSVKSLFERYFLRLLYLGWRIINIINIKLQENTMVTNMWNQRHYGKCNEWYSFEINPSMIKIQ